jgi:AcrR family transcriptional regulator
MAKAEGSYHHGALKDALLVAAEAMLEAGGAASVSLRAVARAAGVSHAAPAHHFGDLEGLLAELAAVGFDRFAAHLSARRDAAGEAGKLRAIGLAYVDFALRWPGMFLLMFRGARPAGERPRLAAAQAAAFAVLSGETGGDRRQVDAVAAWAIVHGLAMLLLDGRLPVEVGREAVVDAVLERLK